MQTQEGRAGWIERTLLESKGNEQFGNLLTTNLRQEVRHSLVKNTEQATSKFTKHGHNKDGQEWMESCDKEAT